MANAIASGSATRPTVTPATRSFSSAPAEYPPRTVSTIFGSGTERRLIIAWLHSYINIYLNARQPRRLRSDRRPPGVQGRILPRPGASGPHPHSGTAGHRRPQRAGTAGGARPRAAGGVTAAGGSPLQQYRVGTQARRQ